MHFKFYFYVNAVAVQPATAGRRCRRPPAFLGSALTCAARVCSCSHIQFFKFFLLVNLNTWGFFSIGGPVRLGLTGRSLRCILQDAGKKAVSGTMTRKLFYSAPFGAFLLSLDWISYSVAIHLSAANETFPRGEAALLSQPYLREEAEGGFGLSPSSEPSFLQKGFLFGRKRKGKPGGEPTPQAHGENPELWLTSTGGPFPATASESLGSPTEKVTQPGDFDDGPPAESRRKPVAVGPVRVGTTIRRGADSFRKKQQEHGPRHIPISERRYGPASALGGPTPITQASGAGAPTSGPTDPFGSFPADLSGSLPAVSGPSQPITSAVTEDPWITRGPSTQFPSQGSAQSPFAAPRPPFPSQSPATPTAGQGTRGYPFSPTSTAGQTVAFVFPGSGEGSTGKPPRLGAPVLPPIPTGGLPKLRATLSQEGGSPSTTSEGPKRVPRKAPPKPPRRNLPVSSQSMDEGSTGSVGIQPIPTPRKTPPKPPLRRQPQSVDESALLGGPSESASPAWDADDEDDEPPPDFIPPLPPGKRPRQQ
ncbi:hypothetical protein, conserved [Eimeria maxima]|uniref:Uncharacterized protein n=1 Tax=Eimeria maxima TaxID=5804 RepID=U6M4F4_EIMMA|nr:hypothetical protein, conserved [Eimeria maxima]CDJ57963.1 hypothetical protein, conserved [Eimeria maxima]